MVGQERGGMMSGRGYVVKGRGSARVRGSDRCSVNKNCII